MRGTFNSTVGCDGFEQQMCTTPSQPVVSLMALLVMQPSLGLKM